jgi:DNA-directed RNA polymerase subunit RPC12/RpoP
MFGKKKKQASTDPLVHSGPVKTDMHCTECSKNFIAQLDYSLDGNHVVECPHCGHEHCRVIKDGRVTSDRWDSRSQRVDVHKRSVWKHDSQPIQTSSASMFIRQRWLDRLQD